MRRWAATTVLLLAAAGFGQGSDAGSRTLAIPLGEHVERAEDPLAAQRYGFRVDPLTFVSAAESLPAAQVRAFALKAARLRDVPLLARQLDQLLAGQNADGSYGAGEELLSTTHSKLAEAVALGADLDRPEVAKLVAFVRALPAEKRATELHFHFGASLLRLGIKDFPGLAEAIAWVADHPDQWIGTGCPWTPTLAIELLALAPPSPAVSAALDKGLIWLDQNVNGAGCLSYWDPWAIMAVASQVDHPVATSILVRQLPMLLRAQEADGGWGKHSLTVWRALSALGCLDRLRGRPPVPADWEVVRSLPVGELDGFSLVYGAGELWTLANGQAVAVSPRTGAVVRKVPLPAGESFALTWFDGSLAVVQTKPKRLLKLDAETGAVLRTVSLEKMASPLGVAEINHRLYAGDGWLVGGWTIDPRRPKLINPQSLAAPGPLLLTAADSLLWQVDFWTPSIVCSDLSGRLKAWGEKPFGEATAGLAWDGERLWALDGRTRRICALRAANRPISDQDLSF